MNAAFGGVSAGGVGSPLSEVTQTGGGPNAFVASHSGGNAGGVALSKFSAEVTRPEHGGHRSPLRICAAVVASATPAAISNSSKKKLRSRVGVSASFGFLTIAAEIRTMFLLNLQSGCQLFSHHVIASFSPANDCKKRVRFSSVIL